MLGAIFNRRSHESRAPPCLPIRSRLARASLLGKVVVREFDGAVLRGRIVETEAYLPHDPACHAYRGMTQRNRSLFLERGHSYVYLCYGISQMLNVSSESRGIGAGVLLRALEPLHGMEHMQCKPKASKLVDLARGPGRLTAAFKVDRRHDGLEPLSASTQRLDRQTTISQPGTHL